MMTKEQETCGQIVESINDFLTAYAKPSVVPSETDREAARQALHEMRHNVIHLGNAIGEMRTPIGLDKEQRDALAFLLEVTSEVASDTLEALKLDNARRVLGPLLEEPKEST
ncbi:MAG: hypothetical protein AB7W59_00340 [Acidimicrobiia bacterium]